MDLATTAHAPVEVYTDIEPQPSVTTVQRLVDHFRARLPAAKHNRWFFDNNPQAVGGHDVERLYRQSVRPPEPASRGRALPCA